MTGRRTPAARLAQSASSGPNAAPPLFTELHASMSLREPLNTGVPSLWPTLEDDIKTSDWVPDGLAPLFEKVMRELPAFPGPICSVRGMGT